MVCKQCFEVKLKVEVSCSQKDSTSEETCG